MALSDKIKALMNLKGKKSFELAEYFNMSPQAMRNKMSRQSFSATDLIKISDFLGAKLIIEIDESQRIIFDPLDITKEQE